MRRTAVLGLLFAVGLAGCTSGSPAQLDPGPTPSATTDASASAAPTTSAPTTAAPSTVSPTPRATTPTPRPKPARFDPDRVLKDVVHLAEDIGPREATSRNFARAADFVDDRLSDLGYDVRRTRVRVPAGNSWGTPVRRGTSVNVVAEPPGFDSRDAHLVIGAHLDTIPVAPGGEDNASGVAVLLELARLARIEEPNRPIQFVAFGAEEPRGPGDALHHFGSTQFVADLSRAERRAIRGMVALDRVGVRAGYVPVCRAEEGGTRLRSALRAAGRHADITTRACANTTSDHWSYAKAGIPAARIGSIPYPQYHSRRDTAGVVDRRQLARVGRLMWTWLSD